MCVILGAKVPNHTIETENMASGPVATAQTIMRAKGQSQETAQPGESGPLEVTRGKGDLGSPVYSLSSPTHPYSL